MATTARLALCSRRASSRSSELSGTALPAVSARRAAPRGSTAALPLTIARSTVDLSSIKQRPVSDAAANKGKAIRKVQQTAGEDRDNTQNNKSSIGSIGLTIHNTPVEVREKLAVPQEMWPQAIAELCRYPHIEEAAILSTCNRLEIYFVAISWHQGVREVEDWMSKYGGMGLDELRPYMFLLRDSDATEHVLHVSAGLDSLVLGEGQILSQVKSVHEVGEPLDGYGRHLNGLFKAAITAGKRVRTETNIASGAVSVSSAAAELALMKLPTGTYSDAKVCIVGAGKMSKLLVKHLLSKRCTDIVVVNRSTPRVEQLQEDFPDANITAALLPELMEQVAAADVIFFAASCEDPMVSKTDLESMPLCGEKVGGVRRLFDIGVPRNVAADVNELSEAHVYNVDDLKEVVEANKESRNQAARDAQYLLEEEQNSFEAWRDSLETVPTIKRLRGKAEQIRFVALEQCLKKLENNGTLNKKERKAVEDMSRGIVNKLLHGPMQHLRTDGSDPGAVADTVLNMHVLEKVFELQPNDLASHVWQAKGSPPKGRKN